MDAELRGLGAEAEFIHADVRHEKEVRNLVDQTVARFGRLDIAVNNAGTEGTPGPVTAQTAESYAATFDTNVLGTLLSLKHELRVMQPQGSGSIVNISSTMGERGAANASTLHRQQARGGRADQVGGAGSRCRSASASMRSRPARQKPACSTGFTGSAGQARPRATPPCRSNAVASPEEIADAIVFLASDKAAFITGQVIRVNGGKTAS